MDEVVKLIELNKGKDSSTINWDLINAYRFAITQYPMISLELKLEQELWNNAIKDRLMSIKQHNPPIFLQSLVAVDRFYVQLLEELCHSFLLNLPPNNIFPHLHYPLGRRKDSSSDYELFLCQYCLIHVGDIARYHGDTTARQYYQLAVDVEPQNGHPYNQLAILETMDGNKLGAVFYYIRSVAVPNPFQPGLHNLLGIFKKVCKQGLSPSTSSMVDSWASTLIFFHAALHTGQGHQRLDYLRSRFRERFTVLVDEACPSPSTLIHVVVLNLYITDLIFNKLKSPTSSQFFEAIGFTVELLLIFVKAALPVNEGHINSAMLSPLKLIMDWLCSNRELFLLPIFPSKLWVMLCPLLNRLTSQPKSVQYGRTALPEDGEVQCFSPLLLTQQMLDFDEFVPPAMQTQVRSLRLVDHAAWIADEFPERRFLSYQTDNSVRIFTFSGSRTSMTYPGSFFRQSSDKLMNNS